MTPTSFKQVIENFKPSEEKPIFEKYVNLTSKLINRPYIQVVKLVESWEIHTIIRIYNDCNTYTGEIPKDILWWSIRKKLNNK